MSGQYTIRQFRSDEWQDLKAIRLEALQKECGKFGASYDKDKSKPDTEWLSRLVQDDVAFFALFDCDVIIGMTGAYISDEDTAKFIASYIREEYRGQGLSGLFYQARIDWAKQQGAKRIIVGHRVSNTASKHANQKFGFKHIDIEKDIAWPDGTTEDHLVYELVL